MDKVDIRNRIREFRFKTEEMTQQALADRAGRSRWYNAANRHRFGKGQILPIS